jgi:carbamoyltransferase
MHTAVLAEHADDYFEMIGPSPYMLVAVEARPLGRARVPGIVHADGSARVLTVDREVEPRYHSLISRFHELAGSPLVLNTSFNGYGEPMVESPQDAVRSMHAMGLDALAIGDYLAWPEDRAP